MNARASWVSLAVVACVVVGALWWQRERARPEPLEAPHAVERAHDAASETLRAATADMEVSATEVAALEPRREPVVATVSPAATEAPERTSAAHDGLPRLFGRAVDERGAPIQRARLRVTLRGFDWMPTDRGPVTTVRADRAGRFEWVLDEALTEPWEADLRTRVDRRALVATFRVEPLASGVRDVGDVRFGLPPLIVSGRLVDDVGRPVARAPLKVIWFHTGDGDVMAPRRELFWGTSDRDGTFALRSQPLSVPEGGRLELHVRAEGFAEAEQEFELGTDVGTWTLTELGALTGRLVLDPAWPAGLLTVEVVAVAGDFHPRGPAAVGADGTFSVVGLPDGTYDLWLGGRTWIGPQVPLWSSMVVRDRGAVALTEPWDVRPLVTMTAVTVIGPDGRAIKSVVATKGSSRGEHQRSSTTGLDAGPGGALHLAHRPEGGSVRLNPPGCMEVVVQCDGTPVTVSALQAPRVEIRFVDHGTSAPANGLRAWPTHQESFVSAPILAIDEDGGVSFEAPAVGAWEIFVLRPSGDNRPGVSAGVVEVVAGEPVQSFELHLPAEFFQTPETDEEDRR